MSDDPNIIGIEASHLEQAARVLLGSFRGRPRISALLEAMCNGLQLCEEDLFDLTQTRIIDLAEGSALDQWAALVGQPPGTLLPFELRQMIQARLLANITVGTPDELVNIYRAALGNVILCRYRLQAPAGFFIWATRASYVTDPHRRAIRRLMADVKPAGVEMTIVEGLATSNSGGGIAGARTIYP